MNAAYAAGTRSNSNDGGWSGTQNVPNSTDMRIPRCHDADVSFEDAMRKSGVSRRALPKRTRARRATLPSALEGQIKEICRDMVVQVKRMRQLQEQADELRTALGEWAGPSGADR